MSPRTSDALRQRALELSRAGLSTRKIGRQLGVSHTTIARIRAEGPFGGGPATGSPNIPPPNHGADQAPPPPQPAAFRTGYHDRTLKSFSAPLGFEGWDLDRVRNAIALHDQGMFLESSLLAIVVTRFGPVFAALSQAIAPALALPRYVKGGDRGLSRLLRLEIEEQLAPRGGLLPSVHFPPTLWGAIAICVRLMGFAVLQHVYGEPDEETGVRPVYTRLWPPWAVQYRRYRRTFVALTTDGPVDIISGDGKFTLIADTDEPHFEGAIRALALETVDGTLAKQARASYIDRYGNPKWVGIMPEGTNVHSPEGDAMFDAMETIQGPDGFGVLPAKGDFKVAQMQAAQNSVFESALENVWKFIAAILLGSDGTMSPSTGVYSAPIFAGVRRDLIDRMLTAIVRGVNFGHVAPYLAFNYAASIAEDRSGWKAPVLEIPLPDPDKDARIKSYAERVEKLHAIIKAERDSGCEITQERVDQLAEELDVAAPKLRRKPLQLAQADLSTFVRGGEARQDHDLEPFGDERDDMTIEQLRESAIAEREERKAEAEGEAKAAAEIEVDEETGEAAGEDEPGEPGEESGS